MRSICKPLVAALALASTMALPAVANADPVARLELRLPDEPTQLGDTVVGEVIIDVSGASLGAYSLELGCDGADLEVLSIIGGTTPEFSGTPTHTIQTGPETCGARFNSFQPAGEPTGPLSVARIEFLVRETARPPAAAISLSARSLFAADGGGERFPTPTPAAADLPIQVVPTPTPTVSPTPSPTSATPTPTPTPTPTLRPPHPTPTAPIILPTPPAGDEEIVAIIERPNCNGVAGISNIQGIVYTTLEGAEIERLVTVIFDRDTPNESRINAPCCSDRGDAEVLLSGFAAVFNWCLLEPGHHTITFVFTSSTGRTLTVTREFISHCEHPDDRFLTQEEFNWRTSATSCASDDGGVVVCTPASDICDGEARYEWSQATQGLVLRSDCEADGFHPTPPPACSNTIIRELG